LAHDFDSCHALSHPRAEMPLVASQEMGAFPGNRGSRAPRLQ